MDKVLYIAGYGRSGSTVLDVMLGNHPDIVSVGELAYLLEDWENPDRHCACGHAYRECGFWRLLANHVALSEDTQQLVRQVERRSQTLPVLSGRIAPNVLEAYRVFQRRLFSFISAQAGASVVVDSSKSARDAALRFYALSEIANLDVYVLHLVRDGQATMESCVRKGSNWALEGHGRQKKLPGLRAALGWTLANTWTVGLAKKYLPQDRYLQVRFEDLTSRPSAVLEQVGQFIGVEVGMLVEKVKRGEGFEVGHNVGGNRVRLKQQVRLRTAEAPTHERDLRWYHRLCFEAIGGWAQRWLVRNGN